MSRCSKWLGQTSTSRVQQRVIHGLLRSRKVAPQNGLNLANRDVRGSVWVPAEGARQPPVWVRDCAGAVRGFPQKERGRDARSVQSPVACRRDPGRAPRSEGLLAARLPRLLREARRGAGAVSGPAEPGGPGARVAAQALRHLAPAPGVHGLRGERAPHRLADHRRSAARHPVARLPAHADGRCRNGRRVGAQSSR